MKSMPQSRRNLKRFDPQGLNVSNSQKLEDSKMEYTKPEIVRQVNSLDAVQSGTSKVAFPTDGASGQIKQVTANAYEADE